MKLSQLPKDVLVALALDLDLEYVISLCQTSPIFNEKICQNNNFWLNKLIKEYGIKTNLSNAKKEYLSLDKLLRTDRNELLEMGIITGNLKMVQRAIEGGADPEIKMNLKYQRGDVILNLGHNYYPITISLLFDNDDIINYLLTKLDMSRKERILPYLQNVIDFIQDYRLDKIDKCKIFIKFYSIYLPYIAKTQKEMFSSFWRVVAPKMEEIHKSSDVPCVVSDEFYNKWANFYKDLSK